MKNLIISKLATIEQERNIKIIHAIESGSRAWGFASPDSDYDVRFIYVRDKKDYLRLDEAKDIIEWQLDDLLDINGWDVRKYLQQIYKSSCTAFEWGNSLVVYKTTEEWKELFGGVQQYFSAKHAAYGYYGLAQKNYQLYLKSKEVSYKKYLYSLRPIFACKYIFSEKSAPPMKFAELIKGTEGTALGAAIKELLAIKMAGNEAEMQARIPLIDEFIAKELPVIQNELSSMPDGDRHDWHVLNELFYKIVQGKEQVMKE